MIRWIKDGRMHSKSSARKVTHPSTIPTLGSLTSEFPRDPIQALGLTHPYVMYTRIRLSSSLIFNSNALIIQIIFVIDAQGEILQM